jgi:hypothetical protein
MGSRPRIERIRLAQESAFYEILGGPQFLNNSEREIYLKLRDAVETALAPQDIFDFPECRGHRLQDRGEPAF